MVWYILLFICFAAFGIFIGFLFFIKKKGDVFANRVLGSYAMLFSLELLYNCLKWSGAMPTPSFIHFSFTHAPLWLLYGPLTFIYVRKVTTNRTWNRYDSLFLLPALTIIVLIAPYYHLATTEKITAWNNGEFHKHAWWPPATIWFVIALMVFYGILTLYRFGPNKQVGYRQNNWLYWFVGSYFGFVCVFFCYVFLTRMGWMNPNFDYLVDIVIVIFIGALAFFGFVQPEIFEGKLVRETIPFVKYRKTGLTDALSMEMGKQLEQLMHKEKPYLQNDLRLEVLAARLNLSRNQTSQVINQHFNLSFFDFINQYRIREAKLFLENIEIEKLNITQIAYTVGFNNRVSFYKAFRKFEQSTPTEYANSFRSKSDKLM